MSSRTDWWVEARFGMFIHWGLYAIPAGGEWIRNRELIPDGPYRVYFNEFNPDLYDAREWARLAKRTGQRYAVLTSKHHEGFCLFDSKLTDFKATKTPAGRDLVREYVEAFRAEGLRVGFYYSLIDWQHAHYPVDRLHPRRDDEKAKAEPRDFAKYLEYLHGQVRELLTNYGKIDILWFDFSYDEMKGETWRATELVKRVRTLQPDILINNRLDVHGAGRSALIGDFATPEQIVPAGGIVVGDGEPQPWESCVTINDNWGYARDDPNHKSPAQLVRMLVECVSKNGNLLLNVGPTARGEIQPEHVSRLEAVGRWMRANGESIYGCGAAEFAKPDWGRYTRKGGTVYAHIFEKPAGPIVLRGLVGKIGRARVVADGSEVDVSTPWTMHGNTEDACLSFPGPVLPDELDTVVALELL